MVHLIKGCIFAIVLYGLIVLTVYIFQRKFIYFPSKALPSLNALSTVYAQAYTKTSDGLQLLHWYARKGRSVVVVFHGNAGNIEDRGYRFKFLVDQGYSVLLVGYRGYGSNSGYPTEKHLIADSALVVDWLLKEKRFSEKDMVFFGESLGSGVAISLAARYKVGGLIFEGAPSSVMEVGQRIYPFLPIRWLMKDTWNSKSRIKNVKDIPKLFIHARQDPIVPFYLGQRLFHEALEPKKPLWLNRAGHVDNLELVQQEVLDFLASTENGV